MSKMQNGVGEFRLGGLVRCIDASGHEGPSAEPNRLERGRIYRISTIWLSQNRDGAIGLGLEECPGSQVRNRNQLSGFSSRRFRAVGADAEAQFARLLCVSPEDAIAFEIEEEAQLRRERGARA